MPRLRSPRPVCEPVAARAGRLDPRSAWAFSDADLMARTLTQARYVVPGFDPMGVR